MIKRILKLARENERLVIFDSETERAFVVVPLGEYERLARDAGAEFDTIDDAFDEDSDDTAWTSPADLPWMPEPDGIPDSAFGASGTAPAATQQGRLTEENLIDSIERDIAGWKAAQETEVPVEESPAVAALDELTLTPVPGEESQAPKTGSQDEEKFYIEPVG